MPTINCLICGKEKYFKPSRVKMGYGKFCSKKCTGEEKRGRKLSVATCLKMSESRQGEKHPMFGKKHKTESIKKMSKSHTGHIVLNSTRIKMHERMKGKTPKNLKWLHTFNKGKNHGMWKGDKVGIGAIHDWVQRWKGKPKQCIDCGATSEEKRLGWSNKDHKYKRNLIDYDGRCDMCHQHYDKKYNGYIHRNQFSK